MYRSPHASLRLRHGHAIKIGLCRYHKVEFTVVDINNHFDTVADINNHFDTVADINNHFVTVDEMIHHFDTVEELNILFPNQEQIDENCFEKGVAIVDNKFVYKILKRNPVRELIRTRYWFNALNQGEVDGVRIHHQGKVQYCMKMRYLGKDLAMTIDEWRQESNSSDQQISARFKSFIQKLTTTLNRVRKERNGNFYHGNIKLEHIVVSKEGDLRLINFSNCRLPGEENDRRHIMTEEYIPHCLREGKSPMCFLNPTVDELAFVRTVLEMLYPGTRWKCDGRGKPHFGNGKPDVTLLSSFLMNVQDSLDSALKYDNTSARFRSNRGVVRNAIAIQKTIELENVVYCWNTVYDAVNAILEMDNWHEFPVENSFL